tara:strand:+ start:244 stop:411 length:168 start_codon:yes stop_codon:yes gene_type:complete
MKLYKVKLIVTETHYVDIEAYTEAEAMQKAEDCGVNSMDAHDTNVEAVGVSHESN